MEWNENKKKTHGYAENKSEKQKLIISGPDVFAIVSSFCFRFLLQ